MEKSKELIETKFSESWYFIYNYLFYLHNIAAIYEEGFYFHFQELEKYAMQKLKLPYEGEIVDTYVVVVQKAEK